MSTHCKISNHVRATQETVFRLAARDHGLTRKRLNLETGIPITTLKSWAEGTEMPLSAFVKLAAVIPNGIMSLLIEPAGKAVSDAAHDDTDLDDLALQSIRLLTRYIEARHPNSAGGIRIVHSEIPDLERAAGAVLDRAEKIRAV